MNAVVIEHVPLADLLLAWRNKLQLAASAQVRVRIEEEDAQDVPFETTTTQLLVSGVIGKT